MSTPSDINSNSAVGSTSINNQIENNDENQTTIETRPNNNNDDQTMNTHDNDEHSTTNTPTDDSAPIPQLPPNSTEISNLQSSSQTNATGTPTAADEKEATIKDDHEHEMEDDDGEEDPSKRGQRVSCHQCKTTKENSDLLFCTIKAEKGKRKRKCRKKFCSACLKRSYNMDVSELTSAQRKNWICPACKSTCTCAACQRRTIELMIKQKRAKQLAEQQKNNPQAAAAAAKTASATKTKTPKGSKNKPTAATVISSTPTAAIPIATPVSGTRTARLVSAPASSTTMATAIAQATPISVPTTVTTATAIPTPATAVTATPTPATATALASPATSFSQLNLSAASAIAQQQQQHQLAQQAAIQQQQQQQQQLQALQLQQLQQAQLQQQAAAIAQLNSFNQQPNLTSNSLAALNALNTLQQADAQLYSPPQQTSLLTSNAYEQLQQQQNQQLQAAQLMNQRTRQLLLEKQFGNSGLTQIATNAPSFVRPDEPISPPSATSSNSPVIISPPFGQRNVGSSAQPNSASSAATLSYANSAPPTIRSLAHQNSSLNPNAYSPYQFAHSMRLLNRQHALGNSTAQNNKSTNNNDSLQRYDFDARAQSAPTSQVTTPLTSYGLDVKNSSILPQYSLNQDNLSNAGLAGNGLLSGSQNLGSSFTSPLGVTRQLSNPLLPSSSFSSNFPRKEEDFSSYGNAPTLYSKPQLTMFNNESISPTYTQPTSLQTLDEMAMLQQQQQQDEQLRQLRQNELMMQRQKQLQLLALQNEERNLQLMKDSRLNLQSSGFTGSLFPSSSPSNFSNSFSTPRPYTSIDESSLIQPTLNAQSLNQSLTGFSEEDCRPQYTAPQQAALNYMRSQQLQEMRRQQL